MPKKSQILRLLSKPGEIILQPTTGIKVIANADGIFSYIYPTFKEKNMMVCAQSTKKTRLSVYEMVQNADFVGMFNSLSSNLDKLCLTQHQIIDFVQDHRSWLRKDGEATFFLFKVGKEFFVANVYMVSDGKLKVYVNRFENVSAWLAVDAHRVVVPELQ